MIKKYYIKTGILTVVILFSLLLAGCGSGGNKSQNNEPNIEPGVNNEKIAEDVKQAEKIFQALPSPLESAMLIKSAGARFEKSFLNSTSNVSNYTTNRSMALNLGIYTCDLSFASMYDQTQIIIDYMNSAKKMADGLGILDAINDDDIQRLEENINNSEVIMDIVSQTFLNSNSYLSDNDQPAIATMVLVGGWIEGLYIATQLVDLNDFNGNKLVGRIIDQKLSIDILLNLLNNNKGNPAIDEMIVQVTNLKSVFDKINITTTPIKTEIDPATNVTTLKSEVKTDMSLTVFKELSKTVADIRTSFVK
jgi:hypothetical protein